MDMRASGRYIELDVDKTPDEISEAVMASMVQRDRFIDEDLAGGGLPLISHFAAALPSGTHRRRPAHQRRVINHYRQMFVRKEARVLMTTTNSVSGDAGQHANKPPGLPAVATWIASGSLLALLVFLAVVAWQKNGVDLSSIAPALVTALLGAAVNPPADNSSPPLRGFGQTVWIILVLSAGIVSIMTGVLTLFSSGHPGAAGAFAASVGGLAGLLVDTSDFTVVQKLLGN